MGSISRFTVGHTVAQLQIAQTDGRGSAQCHVQPSSIWRMLVLDEGKPLEGFFKDSLKSSGVAFPERVAGARNLMYEG